MGGMVLRWLTVMVWWVAGGMRALIAMLMAASVLLRLWSGVIAPPESEGRGCTLESG